MTCTQLTDNTFKAELLSDGSFCSDDGDFVTMDDAIAYYLQTLCTKLDNALGITYAAAVVEEGTHLHCHVVLWSAKKPTFDYMKKMCPGVHIEDAKQRLSLNIDYLYKRNGFEDKGHTNRSSIVEFGEYPVTMTASGPSEWVNFIKAGHTYVQLVECYPDSLGRAYGLRQYIKDLEDGDYREWAQRLKELSTSGDTPSGTQ